jgi:uncharacterized protein YutE (UPF0331/DUF86 family)
MSLRKEDRENLIRHIDFLESELQDCPEFRDMDWTTYQTFRDKRRNVERWVENIVNCSINIAKVLLATEGKSVPETYKDILHQIGTIHNFDEKFGNDLSKWARLRNIITHDYLDIKWSSIKNFIDQAEPVYRQLVQGVKDLLANT